MNPKFNPGINLNPALDYFQAIRQRRYEMVSPQMIRVIQLCYQSGITDHDTIKREVLRILKLPKCHHKEDSKTLEILIPEVLIDARVRLKYLQIPLIDPFTKEMMPVQ